MEKYAFLVEILRHLPYPGVALVLLIAGFGVPIPEDVPLLIGGYLCHLGYADITIMLPVGFLSVSASDVTLFCIGRKYGRQVQNIPILGRHLTPARFEKAEQFFQRWGGCSLFIARFLPGVRSAAFLSAGACRIPFWKLIAFDGSAALISVPVWIIAAYWFGDRIETVFFFASRTSMGLAITATLVVAGVIAYHFYFKKKTQLAPAQS